MDASSCFMYIYIYSQYIVDIPDASKDHDLVLELRLVLGFHFDGEFQWLWVRRLPILDQEVLNHRPIDLDQVLDVDLQYEVEGLVLLECDVGGIDRECDEVLSHRDRASLRSLECTCIIKYDVLVQDEYTLFTEEYGLEERLHLRQREARTRRLGRIDETSDVLLVGNVVDDAHLVYEELLQLWVREENLLIQGLVDHLYLQWFELYTFIVEIERPPLSIIMVVGLIVHDLVLLPADDVLEAEVA